jgi:hypothetical protein
MHRVRKYIYEAALESYFKQYHPMKAYQKPNKRLPSEKKTILFSHLLDI